VKVTILYFAGLGERLGRREEVFDLAEGTRLSGLREKVFQKHPDLRAASTRVRWALNETYATGEEALKEGDRIALIPPVSGG
jgi:molybdopterin converting factor subunit 1